MRDAAVILLDVDLDRAERRSTLAHELAHIDLGHRVAGGWFGRRLEAEADRLAAQRLLESVDQLADALATHAGHLAGAAEHLDVPLRVLERRLARLTDDERATIARRVGDLPA